MATIKLKVSEKILDKVLWLLGQFKSEDLQIIENDGKFEADKVYAQNELRRLDSGASKSHSIDELDELLEKSIGQHENRIS
ncbi:hypothetical protein [Algoriphagus hitonicola]|uniref:Uncharacterized protein n=1 Tax=Algoriphagus hitonicola TaxID=435880 RepID=A0A1I2R737_9BACT|nr:hypothetical protein [Algoriphagus hitonicola]SFG35883.1 hypothetical protein SAMN04487988_10384 [Algoriphagus hitonicola]